MSISLIFVFFFVACLILIPLSIEVSYEQVALFKGLGSKMNVQMFALLIIAFLNIIINIIAFVLMDERCKIGSVVTMFGSVDQIS